MSEFPEGLKPLPGVVLEKVNKKLKKASVVVATRAKVVDIYPTELRETPPIFREAIRGLVNKYRGPSESGTAHPYSATIERGIITGSAVIRELLPFKQYNKYAQSETDRLNQVTDYLPNLPCDLADMVKIDGEEYASYLAQTPETFPLVAFRKTGDNPDQRQLAEMYGDSVGYMLKHGVTHILNNALSESQMRDFKLVRAGMLDTADRLADGYEISPADMPEDW